MSTSSVSSPKPGGQQALSSATRPAASKASSPASSDIGGGKASGNAGAAGVSVASSPSGGLVDNVSISNPIGLTVGGADSALLAASTLPTAGIAGAIPAADTLSVSESGKVEGKTDTAEDPEKAQAATEPPKADADPNAVDKNNANNAATPAQETPSASGEKSDTAVSSPPDTQAPMPDTSKAAEKPAPQSSDTPSATETPKELPSSKTDEKPIAEEPAQTPAMETPKELPSSKTDEKPIAEEPAQTPAMENPELEPVQQVPAKPVMQVEEPAPETEPIPPVELNNLVKTVAEPTETVLTEPAKTFIAEPEEAAPFDPLPAEPLVPVETASPLLATLFPNLPPKVVDTLSSSQLGTVLLVNTLFPEIPPEIVLNASSPTELGGVLLGVILQRMTGGSTPNVFSNGQGATLGGLGSSGFGALGGLGGGSRMTSPLGGLLGNWLLNPIGSKPNFTNSSLLNSVGLDPSMPAASSTGSSMPGVSSGLGRGLFSGL